MSGYFHKIIGKTISGVYCRENEITPKGQVFITFDDGTYFEMYTMSGEIKGTKGLNNGDLDHVVGLNHPTGQELCRYPVSNDVMMWIPPLNLRLDQRKALAVPTNEKITHVNDYWDALFTNTQDLVDVLTESEADRIINEYLLNGTSMIANYDRADWGHEIILQEEFKVLDELLKVDFENLEDSEFYGMKRIDKKDNTLEGLLKAFQFKLALKITDSMLIDAIDDFINEALRESVLSPEEIVNVGRILQVIRRLPVITPGISYKVLLGVEENPDLFLELYISDERISILGGHENEEERSYSINWYLDRNGERSPDVDEYDKDLIFRDYFRLDFTMTLAVIDESGTDIL